MNGKYAQDKLQDRITQGQATSASKGVNKYARLPCRGCIASCKNYHRCDGKLWRMND